MKTTFLILIMSVLAIKVNAKNITIPDQNFKSYLVHNFDENKDGEISLKEAEKVVKIDCRNLNIKSLEGISMFTNLEVLDCRNNSLVNLDVSKNVNLVALLCDSNKLKQINTNYNLKLLSCNLNQLTQLDVSKNKELIELSCSENKLKFLNLSKNIKLVNLFCVTNKLTQLNVSKNVNIEVLSCSSNQLQQLDVRNNLQLKRLSCGSNQLKELDVSQNTKLKWLKSNKGNPNLKCIKKSSKLHTAHIIVNKPFCR